MTVFRTDPQTALRENEWLVGKRAKLVAFDAREKAAAKLERVVTGYIFLASAPVEGLAERAHCSSEGMMALYRRRTAENITTLTDLGSTITPVPLKRCAREPGRGRDVSG